MSTERTTTNPFDFVKASDFSDEQIDKYWVDFAGEQTLADIFQPRQIMPMLLLGGKGCGKTHLMRYFSAPVRRLSFGGNISKAITADKYLGVYLRADGLNVNRFDGKGQPEDVWAVVFSYYFELWLATHLLKHIQEALQSSEAVESEVDFVASALELFCCITPANIVSISQMIDYLTSLRKKIDYVVSNVATGRCNTSEIEIGISQGSLVFELPTLAAKHFGPFNGVLFVYLIDEIENFTANQQRFLNSLIRYRRGNSSIKIGARLYGLRTNKTLDGPGEEIRQNSEYEKVELDAWLRENERGYQSLASALIAKRLQQTDFLPGGDPKNINIADFFESLDSGQYYQSVTLDLVKKYKSKDRPYFSKLKGHISEWCEFPPGRTAGDVAAQIVDALRLDEYPLLEKVNTYLLYRKWRGDIGLLKIAIEIGEQSRGFLAGDKNAYPEYLQTVEHYKSDLLAQLYDDCDKQKVVYAGFDTLVHLSQGVPRNLLGLLKYIYRRAYFAGEGPFRSGRKISIGSQVDGVRDAAAWFWEDAQPDSHGPETRRAVQSLAELFRGVRFSLKPAECKLGTFTIEAESGTAASREVLKHAENWSYLIRVQGGGKDRNDGDTLIDKYQLSPMLAPRWGVSEHRRGAIEIREDLFNAIFDPAQRDRLDKLVSARLKEMQEPFRRQSDKQGILF